MSEPIQTISQGNFLLATQQAVSHDNSMSGNGTSVSPLGVANNEWIKIDNTEISYNSSLIVAGSFNLYYNRFLKLVMLTSDVNVKAGSVGRTIMTWSDRLTPVNSTSLGSSLYVATTTLNQSSGATQRWINGCWVWAVKGE